MAGLTDNEVILAAINQVVKAINDLTVSGGGGGRSGGGGGCGCGGVGGVGDGSGSVVDEDPAPDLGNVEEDPPPDGFGSWSEYSDYKCTAANFLFDACLGWFRWLGGLDAAALGATAGAVFGTWLLAQIGAMLAAAAATTVAGGFAVTTALAAAFTAGFLASAPAWVLGLIVAAIAVVTATVGIGFLVVFDALADDFEGKRDDVTCQLFNAQSVSEASDILSTALADSVESFVISAPYNTYEATIRSLGQTIVSYMLPNSFLNKLFTRSDIVENYTAAQTDCEACECNQLVMLLGSYNSETGVLSSQSHGGAHKIAIMFNTTVWAYDWLTTQEFNCGPMAVPEFGSISGGTPVSSFAFEVVGDDVMDLYASSSVMWSNPGQHGRSFWFVRNAPFTVPLVGVEDYGG